jgi:UMF1 family MFS transporter
MDNTIQSGSKGNNFAKNDPRITTGWAFFDWANSAYALVITVAIFPGYFLQITDDVVDVFGLKVSDSTLYAWCISFAYLVIAVLSPILSGIADFGGKKKVFLRFFTLLGSTACFSLIFFTSMHTLWIGVLGFIVATIGFAGGIVFYNAFLPLIATEDQYDALSAKGFIFGFIGCVILLLANLLVILKYQWFGFSDSLDAVRAAFVMVGLWWIGFAQIPLRRLPEDKPAKSNENLMLKGYQELRKAAATLWADRNAKAYLVSFFCSNAGVQAVLFLAATFAEKELGFSSSGLIVLILILQIVAIGGAWASSRLSKIKGNKFSLMVMFVIWTAICITGYFVKTGLDFYMLASAVGLVMGGVQSLARATYAKLLPEDTPDTASFFSFYDVMDKVSTVVGTFTFGVVEQITGGMRNSVMSLALFFIVSLIVLSFVRIQRMNHSA